MSAPTSRPLTLIGMSGVGKSHWSRLLADKYGFCWHDCDAAIAAELAAELQLAEGEAPVHAVGRWMGMPWTPQYSKRERIYLALEAQVTERLLKRACAQRQNAPQVIDTTGSVIYLPNDLLQRVRNETDVVYLRLPESAQEVMLARYLDEPKPVLWAGNFRPLAHESQHATLSRCYPQMLRQRDELYAKLANHVVDSEHPDLPQVLCSLSAL